jgi:hypothetical protein
MTSLLFSRFVGAVAGKVKKFALGILGALDVGVFTNNFLECRFAKALPAE